jgi:hypothetical protein
MADAISVRASGAHANVASTLHGTTRRLAGWEGGGVPLAAQQKGAALDVTEYALLRLQLSVTAHSELGLPSASRLYVALEHAPAAAGPWKELHRFEPMDSVGAQRAVLGAFEGFVRTSHYFVKPGEADSAASITWSLTGEATPELP